MGALLFALAWVLLGVAIFFIAIRGGPRKARASLYRESRRGNVFATIAFVALYVAFGAAIPALVLAGNEEDREVASVGVTLTKDEEEGRKLFGEYCNQCHVLDASKTVGEVGPNLSELRPTYQVVANAVQNGLQRGNGTMPAGLVQGADVEKVACYVERVTRTGPDDKPSPQCKKESPSSRSGGEGRTGESGAEQPER